MSKILLAMTGSVATVLADKIIPALQKDGENEVKVVMTEAALRFANPLQLHKRHGVDVFTDVHEWSFRGDNRVVVPEGEVVWPDETNDGWSTVRGSGLWQKDQPVLHIELRKWADVLCIAPLTANTLAKMSLGLCDNLLTCVYRAWDMTKPVVVAPAMNTMMWDDEITGVQLKSLEFKHNAYHHGVTLLARNLFVVDPVSKRLACGDDGKGALASISDIADTVGQSLRWTWPMFPRACRGIPVDRHPGAFGFARRTAYHTGVDLYCSEHDSVYAVEGGTVVGINPFTGPKINRPKWNDTDAVFVEGFSGVINYGEIIPDRNLKVGDRLRRGQYVGKVTPVIKEGRERPDVPGHSRSMLHFELYPHGHTDWTPWMIGETEHAQLDPTGLLLEIDGAPDPWPEFEGEL